MCLSLSFRLARLHIAGCWQKRGDHAMVCANISSYGHIWPTPTRISFSQLIWTSSSPARCALGLHFCISYVHNHAAYCQLFPMLCCALLVLSLHAISKYVHTGKMYQCDDTPVLFQIHLLNISISTFCNHDLWYFLSPPPRHHTLTIMRTIKWSRSI